MPHWLGVSLAVAFSLIGGYRALRRNTPGSLMALGMAAMAVDMAYFASSEAETAFGPAHPRGPFWAAGFAAIALWPLVRGRVEQACGGPVTHLAGGLAMIYMCLLAEQHAARHGDEAKRADAALAEAASQANHGGHGGHEGPPSLAATPSPSGATATTTTTTATTTLDDVVALTGWALACYFLLAGVSALTRRGPNRSAVMPTVPSINEAVMGFGTAVMLIAMV